MGLERPAGQITVEGAMQSVSEYVLLLAGRRQGNTWDLGSQPLPLIGMLIAVLVVLSCFVDASQLAGPHVGCHKSVAMPQRRGSNNNPAVLNGVPTK